MQTENLSTVTEAELREYIADHRLCQHELIICQELLDALHRQDDKKIAFLNSFGTCARSIHMNLYAHRRALLFGFGNLGFSKYGWLESPIFLDIEKFTFGNESSYSEHSYIEIGRGPNGSWTYAMWYAYGTGAGGGYSLSQFGRIFESKEQAISEGIERLKTKMLEKVGNDDITNYNQKVIQHTLRKIDEYCRKKIQLSLF